MSSTNNFTRGYFEKKYEHTMEIDDFSFWFRQNNSTIQTPAFEIENTTWIIRVEKLYSNPHRLSAVLLLDSYPKSKVQAVFECKVSNNIIKRMTNEIGSFTKWGDQMKILFSPQIPEIKCPIDRLTLHFEIKYFIVSSVEVIPMPESRLSNDLSDLLHSGECADIILRCNGEQFKAHKMILASRSPVFAAMFQHEMKERNSCVVDIVDMDKDVLAEMLQYMYTDRISNLEKLATGLLAAADKYDLGRLRVICEQSLAAKLSVHNAANTLIMAEMYSAEQLRKQSIKFIKSHSGVVVKTTGWKRLVDGNYADLITEIFA